MYRVGILFKNGSTISKNFPKKEQAEDYILEESEKKEIKRAYILNKETGEREKAF